MNNIGDENDDGCESRVMRLTVLTRTRKRVIRRATMVENDYQGKNIHRVEDVNEDQEESDKKSHPTRNNIRRYNEAYPGHDHK